MGGRERRGLTRRHPPGVQGFSLGAGPQVYLSVELAALPYRHYRDSGNIVARLNLPNMRYDPGEKVEVYAAAVKGLVTLEPNPERQLKYADFIDIYAALDDNERQIYERDHPAEAQIMSGTFQRAQEDAMRRGIQQGMQQGMQQGIQQGTQHGEALALLRQLRRKFGDLPDSARQRVESADADTLLEWLDRILDAQTIDEVIH